MKIHSNSDFKDPSKGRAFMENWFAQFQKHTGTNYKKIIIPSLLGETIVWGINTDKPDLKTLVIFPGFRTCAMFWDFNNILKSIKNNYRVFLVDTNGQPCLSDGNTPDIKSDDYGLWASDLLDKLSVKKAVVAGASFGGLVCIKLSIVAPQKVEKAILLNPGCLTPFSLSAKNLYYNMLPILFPTKKNVLKFLDNAVFCGDYHSLKGEAKSLITEYELYVLQNHVDKAQKPYAMDKEELSRINADIYLVLGEKDLLFPFQKSLSIAKKYIQSLKKTYTLPNTGHGIETSTEAIALIEEIMAI
jgi:pimeloyl-ACP methyl ester carboxylesterase